MPTISRNYKSGGIESSEVDLNLYPRNTNGIVTPSAGLLNAPADLDPPLTISTNGTEDNYEQKAVDISGDTACRSYTTAFGWSPWLVQGTAAYADVQTSPTDTTADRLMAVGAFGIGTESTPEITDFNDAVEAGFYRAASTANNPAGLGTAFGTLLVESFSTTGTTQTFVQATPILTVYKRGRVAGVWQSWQPVYTGANLNPNVFTGASNDRIATGEAVGGSTAFFYLSTPTVTTPVSITTSGSFNVTNSGGSVVTGGSAVIPTLQGRTSTGLTVLQVTGLTVTLGENLSLDINVGGSSITVNV